jgi:hypothetical protein
VADQPHADIVAHGADVSRRPRGDDGAP